MYYKNSIKHKYFRFFILILLGLITFEHLKPAITNAEEVKAKQYVPPKHGIKRKITRVPGGSRSNQCQPNSSHPITLLIPKDHIATTVASHPELHWYITDTSYPIRFTLVEPGKINPLYVKNLSVKKPGLIKFKLPESAMPLEQGKLYKWTVSIICNPESPSENLFAKGWIKKVKQPMFDPEANCLENYAQAGIWYDALSCESRLGIQYNKLLREIGLSNLIINESR